MYKVRFHLGRGKHYQHWQIKRIGEEAQYFNPNEVTIILKNCRLHNQVNASKKILSGENKRPCAWVVCESYETAPKQNIPLSIFEIAFNPRKSFNWRLLNHMYEPAMVLVYDMDNIELSFIYSQGRQLYGIQSEIIEKVKEKSTPKKSV